MVAPMNELPDLRTWLKSHPDEDAELTLGRADVQSLSDELLRLRQGNERLRKQNRKVRGRVARLKGGAEVAEDEAGSADD